MTRRKLPDCDGNVDPERLDIDDKPKRRRNKAVTREQVPVPEAAKPWIAEAYKRKKNRPAFTGVMLEPVREKDGTRFEIVSPHADQDAWLNVIADAFATRSQGVIGMFFDHLGALCRESYDHSNEAWKPSERQLNAAIAIIHASRPKDELDAMLCAQAVAIHWMQMRASANMIGGTSGYLDPRSVSICSQLARTFVQQVEAIDRRKRKPRTVRQVITVKRETHNHNHQHVHFEGGRSENGGQPQATGKGQHDGQSIEGARQLEGGAALRLPDSGGRVVPFPGSEGQEALPAPRLR